MKIILFLFILTQSFIQLYSQVPGSAANPMTAPGAIGIDPGSHSLIWMNPLNVDYNEIYFSPDSSLVANLDPSVRIYNGYPATVFTSASLNVYGSLSYNTKYFWCVVEYNTFGSTLSPVWYFKAKSPAVLLYEQFFNSGLEGWQAVGPVGFTNWYWQSSSNAGGFPGEILFNWFPLVTGESYIMSPEFQAAANTYMALGFNYYEDWWSDTVVVGCAYTTDNGNSWTSIWELQATGNVGPESFGTDLYIPGNFRIGFYYTGYSNNIDFFYVDNLIISTPLTIATPPQFLQTLSESTELKVNLQWTPGSSPFPAPITGYQIQRKNGLPTANLPYVTIATTDSAAFQFEDQNVVLNQIYTYRICTVSGPGMLSHYGNESTAYVPLDVPVELTSFIATAEENNVILTWVTATEINNQGFEIQRKKLGDRSQESEWVELSFVPGFGTTTEVQNYFFRDEYLLSGNYIYRLKQMDFDGSFAYSDEVEIEIAQPNVFYLGQNYPNPFNPSTNIKYSIPADGLVTLKVYDVIGKEIITLVNEEKPAGSYEVEFSAKGGSDSGGNAYTLPSGIYLYTLRVSDKFLSGKMILQK